MSVDRKRISAILNECITILEEKGNIYGDETFADASVIASIILKKNITPHDIGIVSLASKLARYANMIDYSKKHNTSIYRKDTVIDAVNYLLLAEDALI